MTKISQVLRPFCLPQFHWQMDGKPQVPSGSSRGERWDLGRGVAPKASALESDRAGLCERPLAFPPPPPDAGERPSPPSEASRPNAVGPRGAQGLDPSCCWRLLFTRWCSLGVAVSLPSADRSEEVEGRQRGGLLLPFWVCGLGEEDEGAETEK